MDLQELREKYDRVPDEEQAIAAVKTAWEQVLQNVLRGACAHSSTAAV